MCSELNVCLGSWFSENWFQYDFRCNGRFNERQNISVQSHIQVIAQHCQWSLQAQKGLFHRDMNYNLVPSISFLLSFKLVICVGALMVLLIKCITEKSFIFGSCIDSGD